MFARVLRQFPIDLYWDLFFLSFSPLLIFLVFFAIPAVLTILSLCRAFDISTFASRYKRLGRSSRCVNTQRVAGGTCIVPTRVFLRRCNSTTYSVVAESQCTCTRSGRKQCRLYDFQNLDHRVCPNLSQLDCIRIV